MRDWGGDAVRRLKGLVVRVLLIQCDGCMPNIALMRLAAHHRSQGDFVYLQQMRRPDSGLVERGLFDDWDRVYASLIFTKSQPIARRLLQVYPQAVVGGTGWNFKTLEDYGVPTEGPMDYSDYPGCRQSIGFTQRGCRLNCGFCVVPSKEGSVHDTKTVHQLWRGEPWPRELILLDNDFFGSATWRDKIAEIRSGGFKVSFTQGINARMLSDEAAETMASVKYRNDAMTRPCLHTAWDNLGDEKPLFRGLNALVRHGVKPDHITVYMLIGYREPRLTEEDFERQRKLREFGCRPYPMPFIRGRRGQPGYDLVRFQTWVVGAYDKRIDWQTWMAADGRPEKIGSIA